MKLSTLVFTTALLLTACGSDELAEPLTRDYGNYMGEFKSLGGIEVQENITHLFETEDGEILYAYSERYDLDDEAYFGKRVDAYGVVTTYENLDKPLFEVKQITEAAEEETTNEEVTDVAYQDPDLGFSMTYPSNWTLTVTPTSVILEAPRVEGADDTEATEQDPSEVKADRIVVMRTDGQLTKTSDDTQEDRATEVREYVKSHYSDLSTLTGELAYVGPDRLLSVRYKTTDGDTLYFIPRNMELFEFSYYHETADDTERLENGNIFATIASGFRFTTYGETAEIPEETHEEADPEEDTIPENGTSTTEQTEITKYRDFESKTFQFKMSYPNNWYYSGNNTGYSFDDAPIDEDLSGAILTMSFGGTGTEGVTRTSTTVTVTVEEGGRYYSITGPAEYENVMKTMAESILSTADLENEKG